MSAAQYFALKYIPFTLTIYLADSYTRYKDQICFVPFDDIITEFDCSI
jgi:hypothetical protein